MNEKWTPAGWRSKPILQVPDYPDGLALAAVEAKLASYPPLVFAGEARKLKAKLGDVAAGKAFLLQGGDCAESFAEHGADNIRDFFRVFLQMAVVLTFAATSPVVKVGGSPGNSPNPVPPDGKKGRRGNCQAIAATSSMGRTSTPTPGGPIRRRQEMAYRQSAATLNLLRAFAQGGYANLDHVHQWMLGFIADSPQRERYEQLADRISETLNFMRAIGINPESHPELNQTDFFTSHEALLLGYEQAMTRVDSTSGDWYATSGHMIWIGDRRASRTTPMWSSAAA
jgi:3-deoxy-7-phosphoheptulonate synthase